MGTSFVSRLGNNRLFGLAFSIAMGCLIVLSFLVLEAPSAKAEPGLDYIQIRTEGHGGGVIVGNMTYYVGDTAIFWAAGYNYSGYIGDVEVNWSSRNTGVGTVEITGNHTTFRAVGPGETIVYAYRSGPPNGTDLITNQTGVITVVIKNIDYIQIRDAPHGGGEVVGDRSFYIGDVDSFYAAAYNFSGAFLGDVVVSWSSTNGTVCGLTRELYRVDFKALDAGTCVITAEYNATLNNHTGTITVNHRPVLTVDDSGGADYLTIHEAVENASAGYLIYVYNGTYTEHAVIDKSLTIQGESAGNTFVGGGGSGMVFRVTAANVNITGFTVSDAEYAFYLDHSNETLITHNKITSYTYGIYSNRTAGAFIAWNAIAVGEFGVVTDHAKNDAVRWNEISYNTQYGAKDFDSSLRNCFNWNHFHHNKVAYYYDPTQPLDPLVFDGNRIEENEIGIKAYLVSSLIATNNTILNNGVGIEIIDSSPYVADNIVSQNTIGIRFQNSSAQLHGNIIDGGDYGILGSGRSPSMDYNTIIDARLYEVLITGGDGVRLVGNNLGGGVIRLVDSLVSELVLKNSVVQQVNSTVFSWNLDATSRIDVQWYLALSFTDEGGKAIPAVTLRVYDAYWRELVNNVTETDGRAGPFILTQKIMRITGDETMGAYIVNASSVGRASTTSVLLDGNKQLSIVLGPIPGLGEGLPWAFLIVVGSAFVLTVGGLMSMEVFVYFLLSLFVPLYTKLRKENLLDHYSRGRVYQFIELNPGEHFNAVRKALDLNIGTATYHLDVLERSGIIRSRLDGIYKRFYPANMPIPPLNGNGVSEVQQRVLTVIKESPGISQKEIAALFGIRQSTLNYQVTKLEEKGLVKAQRKGRKVQYFANDAPPPPRA